ncbi:MAG TPA: hypothetical protein VI461_03200, partial [Chitinophagaceae bacterium]|nr:hypothetical protein [Chitinophagaceae bacterium]
MKNPDYLPHPFEPTKDELPPEPRFHFALDRRKFLQLTSGGLVVAFVLQDMFSLAGETSSAETSQDAASGVAAWIHIG